MVEPGAAPADAAWLGLVDGPAPPGQVETAIALRRHVVVVWEASRERLGLLDPASPLDWRRLHDRLAAEAEARFVLPLPTAPLGADGLALLALGYAGAATLSDAAADDPALRAWLAPFYQRQLRPRSDETIQFEDWARYRATLGDAGLLPEPEALQLQAVLGRQARLHLRYPPLDLTRGYALRLPARPSPAQERLRSALTGLTAQRLLAEHGFRPERGHAGAGPGAVRRRPRGRRPLGGAPAGGRAHAGARAPGAVVPSVSPAARPTRPRRDR